MCTPTFARSGSTTKRPFQLVKTVVVDHPYLRVGGQMTWVSRVCIALAILFALVSTAATAQTRRVLLLHSYGPQFVPWTYYAARFREELFKQSPEKIDLYEASLESGRREPRDDLPVRAACRWATCMGCRGKANLIIQVFEGPGGLLAGAQARALAS